MFTTQKAQVEGSLSKAESAGTACVAQSSAWLGQGNGQGMDRVMDRVGASTDRKPINFPVNVQF